MKKISANYIFTGITPPIKNGVITLDDDGTILNITALENENNTINIVYYEGIISPGFINTHCHLELSYLYQKLPQHTQLPDFIKNVVQQRNNFSEKERLAAIKKAEQEMITNGIVAVGDISNDDSTFQLKKKNRLYYHTFIELFEINPLKAKATLDYAKQLQQKYFNANQVTITPHAPYSVSSELMKLINHEHPSVLSIHNQETASENEFFHTRNGALYEQLFTFNNQIEQWKPTKKNSLPSYLEHLAESKNLLLVHNTFTNSDDIAFTKQFPINCFWCFCPNANLYIENKLPNFSLFENEMCTIGTDSLASNHSLSILEELKTISKNNRDIPLEKMITWATFNGAQFLKIEHLFGSLEKGKKPGINLIQNIDLQELKLLPTSTIKKLF